MFDLPKYKAILELDPGSLVGCDLNAALRQMIYQYESLWEPANETH